METTRKEIGRILLDGPVIISDPCYEPDIWCAFNMHVKPGRYVCSVEKTVDGHIASIEAVKEDYAGSLEWVIRGYSAVDSGQMGIWDRLYYLSYQDNDWDGGWYRRVCEITLADAQTGTIDGRGCVSSSGYGDGCYDVSSAYDSNGCIIANKVDFIYEDEEV